MCQFLFKAKFTHFRFKDDVKVCLKKNFFDFASFSAHTTVQLLKSFVRLDLCIFSCCILVSEVCPGRKLAAVPKHLGFLDKFGKDAVSHQKSKLWKLRLGDRKSLECTHTHFVLFCTFKNWEIRLTVYFPNPEMASGTLQPLVEKSHLMQRCQWSIAQKQCLLHLR